MKRVRAIILENNKIVVIKREKQNELYWVFPGGGVEPTDDDLESALIRECEEELGVKVIINDLFFKQDFNGQVEYFFICHIKSGKLGSGNGPEYLNGGFYVGSHKVEVHKASELKSLNLKPRNVRDSIVDFLNTIYFNADSGNHFGLFTCCDKDFFYKIDTNENIEKEYIGYYKIKKHYPVPKLIHKIKLKDKGVLIFSKVPSISKDRGLLVDHVSANNKIDARYYSILKLYRKVFLKTKKTSNEKSCNVFFRDRVTSRLTKFYSNEYLEKFDNLEIKINGSNVVMQTSAVYRNIVDFFKQNKKTITIISQCDPNDLNIGTAPIILDYLAGGRNPIMAEFATFFWYNLVQGNYLSLRYNENAFQNHEKIFDMQDDVNLNGNEIRHKISLYRRQAIIAYFDEIMVKLLKNEKNISELYIEFTNYLAMKILAVFDIKQMEGKDQLLSFAYLNYFYGKKVTSLLDIKKLILSLWK